MTTSGTGVKQIKTDLDGIGHILADLRIEVPRYQRSYMWTEREIVDFYEDLDIAMLEKLEEYFLGSIVLIRNSSASELPQLVDGQQRLATTTILLAAVRDYFHNLGEADRAETISSTYLFKKELRTLDLIPRLILNQADNDFFTKRILAEPDSTERGVSATKDSHRRMELAASKAQSFVEKLGARSTDKIEAVMDLVDLLTDRVVVIVVEVPDHSNAFRIFETLNDRGLELAISDLLKNYLFRVSDNRIEEVQRRWILMLGTLEPVGGEELTVQYIRHLWSAKHGATREKDLYDKIKSELTDKKSAVDFAIALADNAVRYSAIINPDTESWAKYGTGAQMHMSTLNLLGMVQIRPLILAVLENFTVAEARKALRLFVSWAVRFLIVGGLGGGTLENHYSQRAKEISEGKITNTSKLAAAMKAVVPSDAEFLADFTTATVSKPSLARYYIGALELQHKGVAEPALVPNPNEEHVDLEHVLPQSPSAAWSHFDADTAKANYRRIGNLALLRKRTNSAAGNAGFTAKKEIYKKSEFELTKKIAKSKDWTPNEISARQKELAKLAVQTWPLK